MPDVLIFKKDKFIKIIQIPRFQQEIHYLSEDGEIEIMSVQILFSSLGNGKGTPLLVASKSKLELHAVLKAIRRAFKK